MSSPLLARWNRSQRKPTLSTGHPVEDRDHVVGGPQRVRLGPADRLQQDRRRMAAAASAARVRFSVASSSCCSGGTPSTRLPYSALWARTSSASRCRRSRRCCRGTPPTAPGWRARRSQGRPGRRRRSSGRSGGPRRRVRRRRNASIAAIGGHRLVRPGPPELDRGEAGGLGCRRPLAAAAPR